MVKKKTALSLLSAALLAALLVSCGGGSDVPAASASTPAQPEASSAPAESSSPASTSADVSTPDEVPADTVKEFPLTVNDVIGHLTDALSGAYVDGTLDSLTVLVDPTVTDGNDSTFGYHQAYNFKIGPGASIIFYAAYSATPGDGRIRGISVMTTDPDIDNATIQAVGYIIGSLEGGLAGDEVYDVDAALNEVPFPADAFATYEASDADFLYMAQDRCLLFNVVPS